MQDPRIVDYENENRLQEYIDHHNRQKHFNRDYFCFYRFMLPICEFIDKYKSVDFTVVVTGGDPQDIYEKLIPVVPSSVKWAFYGKEEFWEKNVAAWAKTLPSNAEVHVQMFDKDTAATYAPAQRGDQKILFLNRIDTRRDYDNPQDSVPHDMELRKQLTEIVQADMTFEEMRPAYDSETFTVHVGKWFKTVYGLSQTAMIWLQVDRQKQYQLKMFNTKKWDQIMAYHNENLRPQYDREMTRLLIKKYLNLTPLATFVTSHNTEALIKKYFGPMFFNPYVV